MRAQLGENHVLDTFSTTKARGIRGLSQFFLSLIAGLLALAGTSAQAQVTSFGGNAQHTSLYTTHAAQSLNSIHWQTTIDFNNNAAFAHYGAPLVSAANTVFVPQKTVTNGFQVSTFDGGTGASKYTLASDYILPSHNWIPVYQPVLTTGPSGARIAYAGAGGTIFFVDNADSSSPTAPVRAAFYGLASYTANTSGFNGSVFINTPLTADSSGNIFFGFRVENATAPAPLNTTRSGFARVDPNGNGTFVLVDAATGDPTVTHDTHNAAPALSADGTTVYVVCKVSNAYSGGYLLGLDSQTLGTKFKVFLKDPRNGNNAGVLDDSTASPMVAPDGDVYIGTMANPDNGSRGFLLRFSSDLSVTKTPGAFGWDYTPAIVPASMVPSYAGSSSYLIFSKYNNYANVGDGDGLNKIALLDPNQTQIDPHPTANGLTEMREVMTVIGITPDTENPSTFGAIREWCINTAAVDPATFSIFTPSEDGHIYRWNMVSNSLTEVMTLGVGIGEPYIPTVIGPDGTVFTLNGGTMFALGDTTGAKITLSSNKPSVQSVNVGDSITFTAVVSKAGGGVPVPTGTVHFVDHAFQGLNPTTLDLGTWIVGNNGQASVTYSALTAGTQPGGFDYGNHYIQAIYSGDGNYASVQTTLVQKVHPFTSTTALTTTGTTPVGSPVTFTATVTPVPALSGTPAGMVTFTKGTQVLGQVPINSSGVAAFTTSTLPIGAYQITATYYSDFQYSTSAGACTQTITAPTTTVASSSPSPAPFGTNVTFSATVTSPNGIPTGTVGFLEGGHVYGQVPVDASGHATLVLNSLPVGTHTLFASFIGDGGWLPSQSANFNEVITGGTSITTVSSPNPSTFNQTVTFTATVSGGGLGTPVGTVTFQEGATVLGTTSVNGNGQATFQISTLPVGNHVITTNFTGALGWGNCTGTAPNQLVRNATATLLVSSANPSSLGQIVTFTAKVVPAVGTVVPKGTVTFFDGATQLSTVTLGASGQAAFATGKLSIGNHSIKATFNGDPGWLTSSASITQLVRILFVP